MTAGLLVSVVIPAYNAELYIHSSVMSVLGQTFRDIEVIVVDDGSSDATAARLSTYGNALRHIRQENAGVSRARNAGIEASRGRLVAFLDADDVWLPDKLARQLQVATQQAAAEADRSSLLSRLGRSDNPETIVGSEAGLASVMVRVDRVAASDVPVLVLGETGSGKEVVARAIHQRSRRAAAPFHRVNCDAIPSGLVDSELFGHERGSFTGAETLRKGRDFRIARRSQFGVVQTGQSVEHFSAQRAIDSRRIVEVEHGIAAAAELHPLVARRQETRAPQPLEQSLVRIGSRAVGDHDDERRQIIRLGAQAVTQPRSEGRSAGLL